MSFILWLLLIGGAASAVYFLDLPVRYNNWVLDRAESQHQDALVVRLGDLLALTLWVLLTFGLIPAMFSSTPTRITDDLGLPDRVSELWFWTVACVVSAIVTALIMLGTSVMWKQVGKYAGRMNSRITSLTTKIIAGVVLWSLYSLLGGIFNQVLPSILAVSSREPNYTLLNGLVGTFSLLLVIHGLLAPVSPDELFMARIINANNMAMSADENVIRGMLAAGNWQLPVMELTAGARRVPRNTVNELLHGGSPAAIRKWGRYVIQDSTGRLGVDRSALAPGDNRSAVSFARLADSHFEE